MSDDVCKMLQKYVRPAVVYGLIVVTLYVLSIIFQSYYATRVVKDAGLSGESASETDSFVQKKKELLEKMAQQGEVSSVEEKRNILLLMEQPKTTAE